MKRLLFPLVLACVSCVALASCSQKTKNQQNPLAAEAQQAADGQQAPDFTLPDLQGNQLALSSLRGKYVVVDFWGSWCIWCIRGIPKMKEAYAKHKDKMEILGVDCRDTEEKWREAVKQHELPWLQVRCPDESLASLAESYGIEGFPTKAIVDPEGKLVKVVVGEDPGFYSFLDELLAE